MYLRRWQTNPDYHPGRFVRLKQRQNRFLPELGDKLPADKKPGIEDALNKLKEAHKSGDVTAIDNAINNMNTVMQAASQQMYQGAAGSQQAGPDANAGAQGAGSQQQQSNGSKQDDNIQDADFEEVK